MNLKKVFGLLFALAVGMAFAQESDIVTVKGKGVGVDETAALKDAYRDAVETAVGLYVDAEQMMKNDELIKDEILTQSNAYIEKYDVLDRQEKNGLVTVKILAKVKKQELTKRISGVMPAKTVAVGDSLARLHAQSATKESKTSDGAALLRKELANFDPYRQLFEVSLASAECVPVETASSLGRPFGSRKRLAAARDEELTVQVDYLFKLEVNSEKFFQKFVPHMERVLSQIALSEPIALRGEIGACDKRSLMASGCFSDYEAYINPSNRARSPHDYGCIGNCFRLNFSPWGNMRAGANRIGDSGRENLHVALVTKANAALTLIKGKGFELDPACAAEYDRWARGRREMPKYAVSFLDADGDELAEQVVDFRNPYQVPCEALCSAAGQKCTGGIWLITPWIGCRSKVYYQWFRFKLAKDDLPKIKSIKVELSE